MKKLSKPCKKYMLYYNRGKGWFAGLVLLSTFSRGDGKKRGQLEWKPNDGAENL